LHIAHNIIILNIGLSQKLAKTRKNEVKVKDNRNVDKMTWNFQRHSVCTLCLKWCTNF